MKLTQQLLFFVLATLLMVSCKDEKRLFEENKDIARQEWFRDQAQSFDFEIVDTAQAYNILANVRTASTYPYYNLFLKVELVNPEGVIIYNDIAEGYLFNPSTGKPYGQTNSILGISLGDLYDQRIMLNANYKFLLPGKYKLRLSHYMRDIDPIQDIMSIGFRVEKL